MSEHHDGLNSAGDIALRDLEPAGRDEVTEDKVPAEPLTDQLACRAARHVQAHVTAAGSAPGEGR